MNDLEKTKFQFFEMPIFEGNAEYSFNNFEPTEDSVFGIKNSVESTGLDGGDRSETKITIETTGVWNGYAFDIDYENQKITIGATGDMELYGLIESFKWLADKLEIIVKESKK